MSYLNLTFYSDFMLAGSRMCRNVHLYGYLTHRIISAVTWNNNEEISTPGFSTHPEKQTMKEGK